MFGFRFSKKLGPFRITRGMRSGSVSVGFGPFRETFSSTGRRTTTVRLGHGLTWRGSNGGRRR